MEQLQRETMSMSRDAKLNILSGLMQCIGADGKSTRDFELRLALGVTIVVPQAQIVKSVLWLKSQV
jgi:hypothetical protein